MADFVKQLSNLVSSLLLLTIQRNISDDALIQGNIRSWATHPEYQFSAIFQVLMKTLLTSFTMGEGRINRADGLSR